MKTYVYTLAITALVTGPSFAATSGKKPAFMDKQQLAAMRAEATSKAVKETTDGAFFTGKPYLASTDGYAFKYRSYSPTAARWTTEDPSGFPDGANASYYAPTPTTQLDLAGLEEITVNFTGSTEYDGTPFDPLDPTASGKFTRIG